MTTGTRPSPWPCCSNSPATRRIWPMMASKRWKLRPTPTMIAIGVASPSAHGQAMISTATAFTRAWASLGSAPQMLQTTNVRRLTRTTAGTKYRAFFLAGLQPRLQPDLTSLLEDQERTQATRTPHHRGTRRRLRRILGLVQPNPKAELLRKFRILAIMKLKVL